MIFVGREINVYNNDDNCEDANDHSFFFNHVITMMLIMMMMVELH